MKKSITEEKSTLTPSTYKCTVHTVWVGTVPARIHAFAFMQYADRLVWYGIVEFNVPLDTV